MRMIPGKEGMKNATHLASEYVVNTALCIVTFY